MASPGDTEVTRAEVPQRGGGDEPKLVFRSGPHRGRVFVLENDRLTIGRDARNDIVIQDDIISSRHVVISRKSEGSDSDNEYWIQDADSKNGTFHNRQTLEGSARLREGDVFCLARTGPEIQFTFGDPSLPSRLSASTGTLVRTGSLDLAFKELFPRAQKGVLTASGVRELIGLEVDHMKRRSRQTIVISTIGVAAMALLAALIWKNVVNDHDGIAEQATLELDVAVSPIYGSLFHSYRETPVGHIELSNRGKKPLTGARLTFGLHLRRRGEDEDLLVEDFALDLPAIAPGESWRASITPRLSNNMLFSTDQEATAEVNVTAAGKAVAELTRGVMIYGRHVINWTSPEQIAAFVDPEDPVVQAFVNAAWGSRPEAGEGEFPPRNTVSAVTLLSAVAGRQLHYLADARTPSTFTGSSTVNDRVKYPGETLLEGTGDCDDLSVLCCALLEAAGVPTAFVVGTDHVLFMFDSGYDDAAIGEGASPPFDPDGVIAWKGRLWIPVETTSLARQGSGFLAAWSDAWKRRHSMDQGDMKIVPIRDAWKQYRPLRPEADEKLLEKLDREVWVTPDLQQKISEAIEELRKQYLESLNSKVERIRSEFEGLESDQAVGLLYARSGLFSAARDVFERVVFAGSPADGGGPRAVPRTREEVLAWSDELDVTRSVLLGDLAVAVTLGARSPSDFALAAGYYELSLRGIPDEYPERAEMMLRLALVYRLSGELSAVKLWTARAFQLDSSLQATYKALIRGDGTVAGDELSRTSVIARYLAKSFARD